MRRLLEFALGSRMRDGLGDISERHAEPVLDSREAEERDLWWGSCAGRSLLPSFLICALLTALLFFVLRSSSRWLPYYLAGAVWLLQLVRWAYRALGWNYRLTTRRLLCQRGLRRQALRAIDLTTIGHVLVERSPLDRMLGVGQLRVVMNDRSPMLVLEGVLNPDHIAVMIRAQVERARETTSTARH